jgi:hypothetical protein
MGMMAAAAIGMQAGGAIAGGINARREGEYQASQYDVAAGQARAASQREAEEEARRSRLAQSRALAVAAASGGGASDPTVVDVISSLAGEGAYRAAVALYEGDEQARVLKARGEAARREGKSKQRAGYIRAASTLLSSGSSLFDKYGRGGPGGDINWEMESGLG